MSSDMNSNTYFIHLLCLNTQLNIHIVLLHKMYVFDHATFLF